MSLCKLYLITAVGLTGFAILDFAIAYLPKQRFSL